MKDEEKYCVTGLSPITGERMRISAICDKKTAESIKRRYLSTGTKHIYTRLVVEPALKEGHLFKSTS